MIGKIRVVFLASVGLLVASRMAGAALFTSEEGRFTAVFPDKPKASQKIVPTNAGDVTVHIVAAEFPGQDAAWSVNYTDYKPEVLKSNGPDGMLDGSLNGTVQSMKGTLLKSNPITQAGAPGREFTWTLVNNKVKLWGRCRLFLVGDRIYQVFILGPDQLTRSTTADQLFQSFKFKEAPAQARIASNATPRPSRPRGREGAGWVTYKGMNEEGGWVVQTPTRLDKSREPGLLGVDSRNVFLSSDGDLSYTIKVQTLPRAGAKSSTAILKAARDGLAEEVEGKVVGQSGVMLSGTDAQEFRLEATKPESAMVRARTMVTGARLYVLSVAGSSDAVAGPSAERFFDSFKLTPRAAGSRERTKNR